MTTTKTRICVTTAPGTNASEVGEAYSGVFGGSWRNSVDACDSDGCGRVFIDYPTADEAEYAAGEMHDDDRVESYRYA